MTYSSDRYQRPAVCGTPGPVTDRRILVIDNDLDTLELLSFNLIGAGYEVSIAVKGAEGLYKAESISPNLLILDLMLPDVGGLEICNKLRSQAATRELPILILTAKSDESDRIQAFELGANDYVTKPFSARELVLRVRNLINGQSASRRKTAVLQVGDLCIDKEAHAASLSGALLALTLTEFRLLVALAEENGRVQSRERLLTVIDTGKDVDLRTVDTHMARLRDKLGKSASLIDTVYGVGYRFVKL